MGLPTRPGRYWWQYAPHSPWELVDVFSYTRRLYMQRRDAPLWPGWYVWRWIPSRAGQQPVDVAGGTWGHMVEDRSVP